MGDPSDGTTALRLITDHIIECKDERRETRALIGELKDLFIKFISGLIACIIVFGGYYFIQSQTLASQLTQARAQQAEAVSLIPSRTADAVAAKLPSHTSSPDN